MPECRTLATVRHHAMVLTDHEFEVPLDAEVVRVAADVHFRDANRTAIRNVVKKRAVAPAHVHGFGDDDVHRVFHHAANVPRCELDVGDDRIERIVRVDPDALPTMVSYCPTEPNDIPPNATVRLVIWSCVILASAVDPTATRMAAAEANSVARARRRSAGRDAPSLKCRCLLLI
jgi:hypothetical protein